MAYIGSQFALPENPIIRAYESCGGLGAFAPWHPGWKQANYRPGGLQPSGVSGIAPTGGLGSMAAHDDCGCGCAGAGTCGGLGDFSIDSMLSDASSALEAPSPIFGLPWMYVLGAAAVAFFLMSPTNASEYRYEKAKARRDYRKKLSSLSSEYPSRGRHAAQHIAAGARGISNLFS